MSSERKIKNNGVKKGDKTILLSVNTKRILISKILFLPISFLSNYYIALLFLFPSKLPSLSSSTFPFSRLHCPPLSSLVLRKHWMISKWRWVQYFDVLLLRSTEFVPQYILLIIFFIVLAIYHVKFIFRFRFIWISPLMFFLVYDSLFRFCIDSKQFFYFRLWILHYFDEWWTSCQVRILHYDYLLINVNFSF